MRRSSVHDSGPGVPPSSSSDIFRAFFTTKPAGEGTGLGLSISRSIIESHGGTLTLDGSAEHTKFEVELPGPRVTLPVVYIDDEPRLCRAFELVLRSHAFDVVTFVDSTAALEYLKEHERSSSSCDYRMAGLDGLGVLAGAPPVPFYLVSGDLGPAETRRYRASRVCCRSRFLPSSSSRLSNATRRPNEAERWRARAPVHPRRGASARTSFRGWVFRNLDDARRRARRPAAE